MASPTPERLIANLRPDLQGLFEEFDIEMNQSKMIALQVFPSIDVGLQAGPFGKITLESLMRAADTKRGSHGEYNEASFEFTDDTYATKENGISVLVDRRNAAIYMNYFNAEAIAARLSRNIVMTNMERLVAALVFDSVTFSPTNVSNEWNVSAGEPINDVESAVQRLSDKGIIANALVISLKVFRNLRNNPQVIDRITANGAGVAAKPSDVTRQMLAAVFDLENILVGGAQYNSAKEGQSASLTQIWDDEYAAVTRIAPQGADITFPCVGRTCHLGDDGSQILVAMETYYSVESRADKVRCRADTHEKLMYEEAVELLGNITK